MTALHADAVAQLRAFASPDRRQRDLRDAFLQHLARHPDGASRSCAPAHVTASAVVIDPAGRRVLLVLHRKLRRWVQPGGHCEPDDPTLSAAALREAIEESGIAELKVLPAVVHVDRHAAPCNPGVVEEHLDVRYAVVAPPGAEPSVSPESLDVRWFAWDALPAGIEETILDMLAAARRWLAVAGADG